MNSVPDGQSIGKACCTCREGKSLESFHKDKGKKDGRSARCKECTASRNAQFRQAHPDHNRIWRLANRAKVAMYRSHNRRKNVDQVRRYRRFWKRTHRAVYNRLSHLRRSRVAALHEAYTIQEWRDLCERYGNICLACGRQGNLTVDHVIPISKGGSNSIENIQPLCGTCNSIKHSKIIDFRS